MANDVLQQLAATIRARRTASADSSYTRQLLDAGPQKCAKKLGEEAIETVIAATAETPEALKAEAADLLYHLLVLLESRGVGIDEVLAVLDDRSGVSGLKEKAERGKRVGHRGDRSVGQPVDEEIDHTCPLNVSSGCGGGSGIRTTRPP